MTNIFDLENFEDFSEKLNMDELYDKKKQHDLEQLQLYNKILNRVHVKIKTTSRQKRDEQSCWYVIPEMIIGVPKYDQGACIAYILNKLQENGFSVRYIHPNVLFICWKFWVPSYVREQMKKKTGMEVDEFGKKKKNEEEEIAEQELGVMGLMTNKQVDKQSLSEPKEKREYNSTKSYKPSGRLVYGNELLEMSDIKLK